MEILTQAYTYIEGWGIHRYGWLFVAAVALIPALVSGNMLQFYLTKLFRQKAPVAVLLKPVLGNLLILVICTTVIATAMYLHS